MVTDTNLTLSSEPATVFIRSDGAGEVEFKLDGMAGDVIDMLFEAVRYIQLECMRQEAEERGLASATVN